MENAVCIQLEASVTIKLADLDALGTLIEGC
jgi:hypothetical protein